MSARKPEDAPQEKPSVEPDKKDAPSEKKGKDYQFNVEQFGVRVCGVCGEKPRTNENGAFCPAGDRECPRYVDPE